MKNNEMTLAEVDAAFEEAKRRVHVSCDEYHTHTPACGITGEKDAVTICRLVETIRGMIEAKDRFCEWAKEFCKR